MTQQCGKMPTAESTASVKLRFSKHIAVTEQLGRCE